MRVVTSRLRYNGAAKLQPRRLRAWRFIMSSEAIVVVVLIAFAVAGLVYLERNSRRNSKEE